MTTPQPQQDKQLKHTDKSFCYCIIDPDSESDHNCDSNHCTAFDHVRKNCGCGFDRASNSHHKNECAFCRSKNTVIKTNYMQDTKPTTPELTPEQDARFNTQPFCFTDYDGRRRLHTNYDTTDEVKAHLATELELQRRELATEIEMIPETFEVENDGEIVEVRKGLSDYKEDVLALLQKETL